MPRKEPPAGAKCEEASPLSHQFYIPCGRPAVAVVYFHRHKEGPYSMCLMCADHNVRNRGATYVEESQIPANPEERAVAAGTDPIDERAADQDAADRAQEREV